MMRNASRSRPLVVTGRRAAWLPGLFAAFLLLAGAAPAAAQDTGRLVGRIVDAASGEGLPDAGVQVVGTTLGAMSGVNGKPRETLKPGATAGRRREHVVASGAAVESASDHLPDRPSFSCSRGLI